MTSRACHLVAGDLHCTLPAGHDGAHGAYLGRCAGEGVAYRWIDRP